MIRFVSLAATLLALTALPASAEVLTMPADAAAEPAPVSVPTRGMNMDAVRATFGDPKARSGPVGQPPITRWDYDGFIVIFENQLVLNAVVPARPPTIYNEAELRPVE